MLCMNVKNKGAEMKRFTHIGMTAVIACAFAVPAAAAQNVTDENLVQMLRKAFKEQPEIIMEILGQHSESVLEIAQQGSMLRNKRKLETQWREDVKQPKKVVLSNRPQLGPETAPVTIVAFSDFTCPHCEQGANTVRQILKAYDKKARYVFKHMPLNKESIGMLASEYFVAAGMQDQNKAWKLYNELFSQRERLIAGGEGFLKEAAAKSGLNMQKLSMDIKSAKARAIIDEDLTEGKRLGVTGTPHFLVNDIVIRGALPSELFKDAVDMALKIADKK